LISAQSLNCFFDANDITNLGTLQTGSVIYWNTSGGIGWSLIDGGVFAKNSYLSWQINSYITEDYSNLALVGPIYSTLAQNEGQLSTNIGNLVSANLTGSKTLGYNYPFPSPAPAVSIIGRSITIYAPDGSEAACCNIGFYISGGNTTVRCNFDPLWGTVSGYIQFNTGGVKTNLTAKSNFGNGPTLLDWEIRTYSVFDQNCGNDLPQYNNYNMTAITSQRLNLTTSGATDSRTLATTAFDSQLTATTTIAGRSVTLRYPNGTIFVACPIGFGVGPKFDVPVPPPTPTPQPTPAKPNSAQSLACSFLLVVLVLFGIYLF